MSNESLQRSVLPNSPADPSIVRVLRVLDPIAREADCAYFVAGATARDLILVNIHGLRPGRATRDIDFGIAVENWDRFALLKEHLVATGDFTSDRHALQRLTYSDRAAGFSIPIDLIPFRGVTADDGTLEWPPSRDIVMNVAGFEEALASSIPIQIEENLIVRVASIPGIVLLSVSANPAAAKNKTRSTFMRHLGHSDVWYATLWPARRRERAPGWSSPQMVPH
jgi:predicted nucleotidyltransferase